MPQFKKYNLLRQKRADFDIFALIMEKIKNKEDDKQQGLQEIVNLKASLNLGLSDKLKERFPNCLPVSRPKIKFEGIPDPNWLSGFAEGEACFFS